MTTPNNTVAGLPNLFSWIVNSLLTDSQLDVVPPGQNKALRYLAALASPAQSAKCEKCKDRGTLMGGRLICDCTCARCGAPSAGSSDGCPNHPAAPSVWPDREAVEVRVATAVEGGTAATLARVLVESQQQCDEDGTMIQVSRQAVDEAVELLHRLATPEQPGSAVQGEQVGELIGYGWISGDAQVRIKRDLPPGTKLYAGAPPTPAAEQPEGKWKLVPVELPSSVIIDGEQIKPPANFGSSWEEFYSKWWSNLIAEVVASPSGVQVDEAMVERALAAPFDNYTVSSFVPMKSPANVRRWMRAALTAALAGKDGA